MDEIHFPKRIQEPFPEIFQESLKKKQFQKVLEYRKTTVKLFFAISYL